MSVSVSSQAECSLAPKASQPASPQVTACPFPSAPELQPNGPLITSENSSLMLPLSPSEFAELKAQWLKETSRVTKSDGDGFRYAANVRLNSRLYKPLYRFSKEHGFTLSTSLQYAVYSLLSNHAL